MMGTGSGLRLLLRLASRRGSPARTPKEPPAPRERIPSITGEEPAPRGRGTVARQRLERAPPLPGAPVAAMVGRKLPGPRRRRPQAQSPHRDPRCNTRTFTAVSFSIPSSPKPGTAKHRTKEGHYAASTGHVQWLQVLTQKTESPTQLDINGFSTLHTAALHGRLDCMKMLVEKYFLDVNQASLRGWRPIHLVLAQENKNTALECLQYLLSRGADPNVKNQSGVSPLHKVASEGSEKCLQVLIEAGADVHIQDNEGQKPIDLCRMWGYRDCAKRLSHAMWKADKKHRLREMCKLQALKLDCEIKQREFIQKEQAELNFFNNLAFEQWLFKKGLPPPTRCIVDIPLLRRQSVVLRKVAGEMASPMPSLKHMMGEPLKLTCSKPWKYRRQKPWNLSTNLASEPATSICRPEVIRLGVEPEKPLEHDFTSFLFLFRNAFGETVIQIDDIGRVRAVPDLPYDLIEKNLYPRAQHTRLQLPKGLWPVHIFNLKHRRPAGPQYWWTDQMALSLRGTLDPLFLRTLDAHCAYYSSPAPSPRTAATEGPPPPQAN